MSKPKGSKEPKEPKEPKNTKGIDALFKNGSLRRGGDDTLIIRHLPSGIPPLDDIMGGGWPIGDITMIVGPSSAGKTILTQYAAASQQRSDPERPTILYVDTERSYDRDWWEQSGVNVDDILVLRGMAGEEIIDAVYQVIDEVDTLGMIIVDSIAAIPPAVIIEESAGKATIAQLARIMITFYHKIGTTAQRKNISIIMTNQVRNNIGGPGEVFPGGKAVEFYAHIILRARRTEWITEGTERVGFIMEVECRKNKTAPPQGKTLLPFMFDSQIDLVTIMMNEALDRGIIRNRAPYYYIGEEQFLGKANLRTFLQDNVVELDRIKGELYDVKIN